MQGLQLLGDTSLKIIFAQCALLYQTIVVLQRARFTAGLRLAGALSKMNVRIGCGDGMPWPCCSGAIVIAGTNNTQRPGSHNVSGGS